jgi:hypothetical protein
VRADDYKGSGQQAELLKFCLAHDAHGEMEYQASADGEFTACILSVDHSIVVRNADGI